MLVQSALDREESLGDEPLRLYYASSHSPKRSPTACKLGFERCPNLQATEPHSSPAHLSLCKCTFSGRQRRSVKCDSTDKNQIRENAFLAENVIFGTRYSWCCRLPFVYFGLIFNHFMKTTFGHRVMFVVAQGCQIDLRGGRFLQPIGTPIDNF